MRPLDPERAWEYLLTILARQAYTADELRRKLLRRGIEADQAEALLQRLQELRLIDDALYAQQYVSSRKNRQGRRGLRQALHRKGVAERLVNRELGTLDEAQQIEAATALLQRFAWRYRPKATAQGGVGGTEPIADIDADADTDTEAALGTEAESPEHAVDGAITKRSVARPPESLRRVRARAFAFLARRGFGADAAQIALERVGWFDELG